MASNSVFESVRSALTEYYTVLSRMPHYPLNSFELAPPTGWDVDVKGLNALGRSDAAIEFIRHLPYLKPCINCKQAWITSLSPALAFNRGEIWPSYTGEGTGIDLSTSPHLFYLSTAIDARQGISLILDTESGNIVEISKDGGPFADEHMSWDAYDAIPTAERWAAHRTTPAAAFFSRETRRMQRLIYMPIPSVVNSRNRPTFYHRAVNLLEERDLLAVEYEWDADREDDPDYTLDEQAKIEDLQLDDKSDDDDSDDDEEYEDMPLVDDELQELSAETEEYARNNHGPADGDNGQLERAKPRELPPLYQRVYEIYKRNDWPRADFDIERCRSELFDLEAEEKAKVSAEPSSTGSSSTKKEVWCEQRRQHMKKGWQAEGKDWDEEKEMLQSAEERWVEFQQEKRQGRAG